MLSSFSSFVDERESVLVTDDDRVDVAIVGAGLSGLVAALRLRQAGWRVTVLEARERVGGRTAGEPMPGMDAWMDMGAQWVGAKHGRLKAWCERYGLALFPQHSQGQHVLDLKGKRRLYSGLIPKVSPVALMELHLLRQHLARSAARLDPARPWTFSQAQAWDALTAAEVARSKLRTRDARVLFDQACRAIFAAEAHELSWLHLLTYTRQGESFEDLADVTGGAQQDRVAGGVFRLSEHMARELGDQALHLASPVTAIRQSAHDVTLHAGSHVHRARRAIVSVPATLVQRIAFDPALSEGRTARLARMHMGSVIKVLLSYSKPFWRDAGLSGEAISDVEVLSPVFDACMPGRSEGLIVGFFEGHHALMLAALDGESRKQLAVRALVRYFGPQAAHPTAYVERNWQADPWSRGGYAGLCAPGAWTLPGADLQRPEGRIHWAGTETATAWMGYMEGAIESGERAAREVQASLMAEASGRAASMLEQRGNADQLEGRDHAQA